MGFRSSMARLDRALTTPREYYYSDDDEEDSDSERDSSPEPKHVRFLCAAATCGHPCGYRCDYIGGAPPRNFSSEYLPTSETPWYRMGRLMPDGRCPGWGYDFADSSGDARRSSNGRRSEGEHSMSSGSDSYSGYSFESGYSPSSRSDSYDEEIPEDSLRLFSESDLYSVRSSESGDSIPYERPSSEERTSDDERVYRSDWARSYEETVPRATSGDYATDSDLSGSIMEDSNESEYGDVSSVYINDIRGGSLALESMRRMERLMTEHSVWEGVFVLVLDAGVSHFFLFLSRVS